jgi:Ca2+-binding RTX toxin-like protein
VKKLALVVLAACAVLALPAAANAAYIGAVVGTTATLTGDAAGDTLTIGVDAGNLTHNRFAAGDPGFASNIDFDSTLPLDQTIPAATGSLTINAGGGDDTVTFDATVGTASTIDGEAGNDLLSGSTGADTMRGGDGNDRVIGFRGGDDVEGGAGNDQLVWNNGDGSDVMDGDGGNDEVEVNGAPTAGDVFTVNPDVTGTRVAFARSNLGPFTLDVSAERMTLNGLGGADTMTGAAGLAPLILIAFNGGVGADNITGGDGPDLISGGEEADTLAGGGGGDRVLGDRGNDVMSGGDGDDTLVWNNGDGSDMMDGEGGSDTVEVNGAPLAGDAFTLQPNGARARFDRTNLGPFTLDIGSSELLDLNGLGGDDTFSAAAGTEGLVGTLALDGGVGNDNLTAGASADVVSGGPGNDALDGGGGADIVQGGDGDDVLALRDGSPDLGLCGPGTDSATADAASVDTLVECEQLDQPAQPPAADTSATALTIRSSRGRVSRRSRRPSVRVTVNCPSSEPGGCNGTLTLTTLRPVPLGAPGTPSASQVIRRLRAVVVLGTVRYALQTGQTRTLRVRLARGATRLARRARIRARVRALNSDAAGNLAESTRRYTIAVRR